MKLPQVPPHDAALEEVCDVLRNNPDLLSVVGRALRKSFDEVIDGARTGRYRIEDLEKTEKTYIGTKVEIVLRAELQIDRGQDLDGCVAGHEVDTKFSLRGDWMIPREAIGKLCLLVTGDDNTGQCKLGLLRTTRHVLRRGVNRDKKTSISAVGKRQIVWLARGAMPRNFMLDLPGAARDAILSAPSGNSGIQELFRHATDQLIPRYVIEQVARQRDPLKRARDAKKFLASEGIRVFCARYDRSEFLRRGFTNFNNDDWLSVRSPRRSRTGLPVRWPMKMR